MPVSTGDDGFCNHCASWATVRTPWDAPNITLCMTCYLQYAQSQDAIAAAFRQIRRERESA